MLMKKHRARSIGDLLAEYIHGSELERPLLERQVIELWPIVLGDSIANLTGKIEMQNGILYVHIQSAALRQQLFEHRHKIIGKLNDAVKAQIIKDIRLLG